MGGGFSTKQPEKNPAGHSAGPPSGVITSSGKQSNNRRSSIQSALVSVGIIKETSQGGSSTPTNSMASGGRRGSHQHVQEEAASFRSKSSSIKMMMRNSAYRKSFFSFLENQHQGKEELMDYFLLVETIKKIKIKEEKRKKFDEAIERYEKKSAGVEVSSPSAVIFASMHHWKGTILSQRKAKNLLSHIPFNVYSTTLVLNLNRRPFHFVHFPLFFCRCY